MTTIDSTKKLVLSDRVSQDSVEDIMRKLLDFDRNEEVNKVELLINTHGGCVDSAFALVDTIFAIGTPVETVASGACMSAGVYILLAGEKRFATPNTRLMIHQMTSGMYGNTEEVRIRLNTGRSLEARNLRFMSKRTGLTVAELRELKSKGFYMTPTKAKELGFIDAILRPPTR